MVQHHRDVSGALEALVFALLFGRHGVRHRLERLLGLLVNSEVLVLLTALVVELNERSLAGLLGVSLRLLEQVVAHCQEQIVELLVLLN